MHEYSGFLIFFKYIYDWGGGCQEKITAIIWYACVTTVDVIGCENYRHMENSLDGLQREKTISARFPLSTHEGPIEGAWHNWMNDDKYDDKFGDKFQKQDQQWSMLEMHIPFCVNPYF